MGFTFRQLEVFVAAAEDCNFRQTAERLGISQPSISNQIRALERWAGGELFQRSRGSTPRLSQRGTLMLTQARQLLTSKSTLELTQRTQPVKTVPLRVAAGPFLLDHFIRPALPRFLQEHPNIILDFILPEESSNLRSAVRRGEADIAVFTGDRSVRNLSGAEFIGEISSSLYGSSRFARLGAKDAAAIGSLPFVLPMEGSPVEGWVLRTLKNAGITPNHVVARSQFGDVIADMVVSGTGVAVLLDEHMARHVRAGRALRFGPPLESGSRVLLLGSRGRSRAAKPFLDFLRQLLKPSSHPLRSG
jgi:LysR family transcriptional regulator, low CO2-responsive transcriptional regulator